MSKMRRRGEQTGEQMVILFKNKFETKEKRKKKLGTPSKKTIVNSDSRTSNSRKRSSPNTC